MWPGCEWPLESNANLVVSLVERHIDSIGRPDDPGVCFGGLDISGIGRAIDSDGAVTI